MDLKIAAETHLPPVAKRASTPRKTARAWLCATLWRLQASQRPGCASDVTPCDPLLAERGCCFLFDVGRKISFFQGRECLQRGRA